MRRTINPALAALLACASFAAAASPCSGVDRSLTAEQRRIYAPAIERHLNAQLGPSLGQTIKMTAADVFQQFRVGKWRILYVSTSLTDEPFLFYDAPPDQRDRYLSDWSGAASMDEGPAIIAWLKREQPGIPRRLAECFAWHVTQARDQ